MAMDVALTYVNDCYQNASLHSSLYYFEFILGRLTNLAMSP